MLVCSVSGPRIKDLLLFSAQIEMFLLTPFLCLSMLSLMESHREHRPWRHARILEATGWFHSIELLKPGWGEQVQQTMASHGLLEQSIVQPTALVEFYKGTRKQRLHDPGDWAMQSWLSWSVSIPMWAYAKQWFWYWTLSWCIPCPSKSLGSDPSLV